MIREPIALQPAFADRLSAIPRFKAWRAPYKDTAGRRVPFQRFPADPLGVSACESLKEASELAAAACDAKDGLFVQEFDSKLGHHILHVFDIKRRTAAWEYHPLTGKRRPVYKSYPVLQFSMGLRAEFNPREVWRGGSGSDPVGLDRDRPASERLLEAELEGGN